MASSDRAALLALYRSTGGARWTENRNWNTDAHLWQWHGVQVNDETRVAKLILNDNNLQGPIPRELGKLTALENLQASSNGLTGSIPEELGGLTKLESLFLGVNKFTGPVPTELGALTALKGLCLHKNGLTGPIPRELGKLTGLTRLQVNDNGLTGPIPEELGSLHKLEVLRLDDNKLTGGVPTSLRKHPNRKHGDFAFHLTEAGAPVPKWNSWRSVAFPLVVGYLDLGTDVSAVISYYHAGHRWWFALGLVFIVGPALFAAIVVLRGEAWLRRVFVALHLGLLVEAWVSLAESSYSHLLVSLRVVEPLYESVPQLMLQVYVLLLEWDSEGDRWPSWRLFSIVMSSFSLAYATTGLVAEQPLSQLYSTADAISAGCPGLTGLLFGTVPPNGSVEVYHGSSWHSQDFVWAFLVYQWLEIGSRFISLALLALVWRGYFFLVLLWLWISRSVILRVSLGEGEELLRFRSQVRLVGMPFMDSVMDALNSYDAGCALTAAEFVAFVTIGSFFYTNEEGQVPDDLRRVWAYVAVAFMAGKLALGYMIVRPFKRVVGFGFGFVDEQGNQALSSRHRSNDVGYRDVESGGVSRGSVRELVHPERRRGGRVQEDRPSAATGQRGPVVRYW